MDKEGISSQQTRQEFDTIQESEEGLRTLLQVLPVGVSILGEDRKPIYTNSSLEKILDLTQEEFNGGKYEQRRYLRADGSEMPACEFPSSRAFEEKRAVSDVEIGIVKENGEIIWTMVSAVYFKHGDWRVVLAIADISSKKYAENSLQKHTEELTERIKELNCLYSISDLVERPGITLEEILQGTVDLLPPSWHFPELTCARAVYDGREYTSKGFKTSAWQQSNDIFVHGHPNGVIEVFYTGEVPEETKSPFLKEEGSLLKAIAERLGRIIERFQAERLLMKLATTDPLTELYNRRHFFNLAEQEVARSQRYEHPLACIMFDIDYFKQINDSYGHLFGDKVLREVVYRCKENVRQVDVFARYGGDEFVILLPETGLERCKQLAERLCTDFRDRTLNIDEREISISLSLGLASLSGNNGLALDTLLNCADTALYEAKKKGRNQFAICNGLNSDISG